MVLSEKLSPGKRSHARRAICFAPTFDLIAAKNERKLTQNREKNELKIFW